MPATFETLDTTGYVWCSSGLGNPTTEVTSWLHERFVTWLGEVCNPVLDSSSLSGGSGYTDGTYSNVELVRDNNQVNGKYLLCDVVVSSGAVTSVTITQKGNGFKTGDTLNVKTLSTIGGTGSGFSIDVLSADASFCLNRDPDDRTSSTYAGWTFGTERGTTNCTYGLYFYKASGATSETTTIGQFYNWMDTSDNRGLGDSNSSHSNTFSFWDNDDSGETIGIAYCSDAGDQYFVVSDSKYKYAFGCYRLQRDPLGTYAPTDYLSRWGMFEANTSFYTNALNNGNYSAPYVGNRQMTNNGLPMDPNAFFRGKALFTRGMVAGSLPAGIGMHENDSGVLADTKTNGSEVFTCMSPTAWVQTSA